VDEWCSPWCKPTRLDGGSSWLIRNLFCCFDFHHKHLLRWSCAVLLSCEWDRKRSRSVNHCILPMLILSHVCVSVVYYCLCPMPPSLLPKAHLLTLLAQDSFTPTCLHFSRVTPLFILPLLVVNRITWPSFVNVAGELAHLNPNG